MSQDNIEWQTPYKRMGSRNWPIYIAVVLLSLFIFYRLSISNYAAKLQEIVVKTTDKSMYDEYQAAVRRLDKSLIHMYRAHDGSEVVFYWKGKNEFPFPGKITVKGLEFEEISNKKDNPGGNP